MILIYLPQDSPRCQYVFYLVFKEHLGVEFHVTKDIKKFEEYSGAKINYSGQRINNEFFIKPSKLMFENEIKKQEINVEVKNGIKVLFPNNDDDSGFDIFSSVFYLVSRYEEYLSFNPDKFGRFKAKDSLAFQHNFLEKPVVDIWIDSFRDQLRKKFPNLTFKSPAFDVILTYDIDVAFKYKGRSLGRTLGSALKDIMGFNLRTLKERLQTLFASKKDPWDVYDDLEKIISENGFSSIFFFLLAEKSKHDKNLHYENREMKKLVNYVKTFSGIGIHPSFYTSSNPEKFLTEKERLEKISAEKITKSRQHFLKFRMPETFNSLLSAGITEDYSMAFPEAAGFRAGTSKPFNFYDVKNEKATQLRLFPVTFMEGNFMTKNTMANESIWECIAALIDEVKKVDGTFISIWHNHTISDTKEYKDWRYLHNAMIKKILL